MDLLEFIKDVPKGVL